MSGEKVYEFPDDGGVALAQVTALAGVGRTQLPLGESLLRIPNLFDLIHYRDRFEKCRFTADEWIMVPGDVRDEQAQWIDENLPSGAATWIDLEVVTFFSGAAEQRFEAAYANVLGYPPVCRPLSTWPHVFCVVDPDLCGISPVPAIPATPC